MSVPTWSTIRRAPLTAICDMFPDRIDKAKTNIPGAEKRACVP